MPLKTRQQVREEFASRGLAYADWARQKGYSPTLVSMIVNDNEGAPQRKCLRGESHNIAVELGLKQGTVSQPMTRPRIQLAAA
ncbi:MAG: DNA-binding protein [Acidovorax sp.]|uniref:DNA-binding protein n=1 Tax=Acidovorax sp. TaxID=1872122 RepID=UPI00391B0185